MVDGKVPACRWVRLACQRHLDDLARAATGWEYRFDDQRANRVCRFIELLPHVKGAWARDRKPIRLEDWQCFALGVPFGWVNVTTGLRRFSVIVIMVPRKNGKSILAAGVGLYMFCADGEPGAEVYSGATTEKQAWEVFRPARIMAKQTPELREAFGIEIGAKRLYIEADESRFEPVVGKPGDGASPHLGIVDEYHEHDTDALLDTFNTGMGAREQPILFVISTAGSNIGGPCHLLQQDLEQVLNGTVQREELFGLIYTLDSGDDWTSDASLRKANPNYGVSVRGDYLQTQIRMAVASPRKQSTVKTKHLNVWVGANTAYLNLERWRQLADAPDIATMIGAPCVAAIDLASKKDITARVLVFKRIVDSKDHYYVYPRLYLPDAQTGKAEHQHYQGWVVMGHLLTTPGNVVDYEKIYADTMADVEQYHITQLCFDPFNAEHFAQKVAGTGACQSLEVPQQVRYLSDPMKTLDALITDGRIHHDGNQCMTWMAGNLTAHVDAKENVFPRKEREESKIDGIVALIMALSRSLLIDATATPFSGFEVW